LEGYTGYREAPRPSVSTLVSVSPPDGRRAGRAGQMRARAANERAEADASSRLLMYTSMWPREYAGFQSKYHSGLLARAI